MGEAEWVETEVQVKAAKNRASKKAREAKQATKKERREETEIEQDKSFFSEKFIYLANNLVEADEEDFVINLFVGHVDKKRRCCQNFFRVPKRSDDCRRSSS